MLINYKGLLLKLPTPYKVKFIFYKVYKYLIAFFTNYILINIKLLTPILTKVLFIIKDNLLYTMLYKTIKGKPLRYFLNLSFKISFYFSNTSPKRELIYSKVKHFLPY